MPRQWTMTDYAHTVLLRQIDNVSRVMCDNCKIVDVAACPHCVLAYLQVALGSLQPETTLDGMAPVATSKEGLPFGIISIGGYYA